MSTGTSGRGGGGGRGNKRGRGSGHQNKGRAPLVAVPLTPGINAPPKKLDKSKDTTPQPGSTASTAAPRSNPRLVPVDSSRADDASPDGFFDTLKNMNIGGSQSVTPRSGLSRSHTPIPEPREQTSSPVPNKYLQHENTAYGAPPRSRTPACESQATSASPSTPLIAEKKLSKGTSKDFSRVSGSSIGAVPTSQLGQTTDIQVDNEIFNKAVAWFKPPGMPKDAQGRKFAGYRGMRVTYLPRQMTQVEIDHLASLFSPFDADFSFHVIQKHVRPYAKILFKTVDEAISACAELQTAHPKIRNRFIKFQADSESAGSATYMNLTPTPYALEPPSPPDPFSTATNMTPATLLSSQMKSNTPGKVTGGERAPSIHNKGQARLAPSIEQAREPQRPQTSAMSEVSQSSKASIIAPHIDDSGTAQREPITADVRAYKNALTLFKPPGIPRAANGCEFMGFRGVHIYNLPLHITSAETDQVLQMFSPKFGNIVERDFSSTSMRATVKLETIEKAMAAFLELEKAKPSIRGQVLKFNVSHREYVWAPPSNTTSLATQTLAGLFSEEARPDVPTIVRSVFCIEITNIDPRTTRATIEAIVYEFDAQMGSVQIERVCDSRGDVRTQKATIPFSERADAEAAVGYLRLKGLDEQEVDVSDTF